MKALFRALAIPVLLAVLALLPSAAFAQATASIAGVVTDASGAVLPGVTVEASSPALIEKVRSVVTDGSGQYRLEQLRGGVYAVTFTLPGFNTIKREGLELSGSFAASVNAEMRVGRRRGDRDGYRRVADRGHPEREPPAGDQPGTAGRDSDRPHAAGGGVHDSRRQPQQRGRGRHQHHQHHRRLDVDPRRQPSATRGLLIDGITIANAEGTGWSANMLPNMGSTQEVAVDYSSASAESITGGLQINMIPKTGGNQYSPDRSSPPPSTPRSRAPTTPTSCAPAACGRPTA